MKALALQLMLDENRRRLHQRELLLHRRLCQIRVRNDITRRAIVAPDQSSWMFECLHGGDGDYMDSIGISKTGFDELLIKFRGPFNRTQKFRGGKGGRPSLITAAMVLGLVLQFYRKPLEIETLARLNGVTKSHCSKLIHMGERILYQILPSCAKAQIVWPSKAVQRSWGRRVEKKFPHFKGRFGFIDGKNMPVQEPTDVDTQNAMYNGWLHCVFVTGVLCFGVDGTIIWGKHNFAGSWNDGEMSRNVQHRLLDPALTEVAHGLVADTLGHSTLWLFCQQISLLSDKAANEVSQQK